MLSGGAAGVILQHAPAREFFDDQEHLGNKIPALASEIALIEMYGKPVLAIALNHEHVPPTEREAVRARTAGECRLPAFYPLLDPLEPIAALLAEFLGQQRNASSGTKR